MGRELSDAGASRVEISAVDIVLSVISNNDSQKEPRYQAFSILCKRQVLEHRRIVVDLLVQHFVVRYHFSVLSSLQDRFSAA